MTEPTLKLKNCPFCDSDNIRISSDLGAYTFMAKCMECESSSSLQQGKHKTLIAWNSRPLEGKYNKLLQWVKELSTAHDPDCLIEMIINHSKKLLKELGEL